MVEGRAFAATLVAALAFACIPDFTASSRYLASTAAPPREPIFERRRSYFDSAAKQLAREHGVLLLHDNTVVAHGRDVAWYSNGRLWREREFDRGEPRGRWRSWFENGALESDAIYAPNQRTTMSWWRADGSLSSSGEHVMGLREGEWSSFHSSGMLAARGVYERGERHGPWIRFDELGRLIECGDFVRGERSGVWEFGPGADGLSQSAQTR